MAATTALTAKTRCRARDDGAGRFTLVPCSGSWPTRSRKKEEETAFARSCSTAFYAQVIRTIAPSSSLSRMRPAIEPEKWARPRIGSMEEGVQRTPFVARMSIPGALRGVTRRTFARTSDVPIGASTIAGCRSATPSPFPCVLRGQPGATLAAGQGEGSPASSGEEPVAAGARSRVPPHQGGPARPLWPHSHQNDTELSFARPGVFQGLGSCRPSQTSRCSV